MAKIPAILDFSQFAWPVTRHADGSVTEQPVPMPFARAHELLGALKQLGYDKVRYGAEDRSMLNRARAQVHHGLELLAERNQYKRSDRRWNAAHTPFGKLVWQMTCELKAFQAQIEGRLLRNLMAADGMPSILTVAEFQAAQLETRRRRQQDEADARSAARDAERRARSDRDLMAEVYACAPRPELPMAAQMRIAGNVPNLSVAGI